LLETAKALDKPFCQKVVGTEGFVQDPATKGTKRFHRDEKSWSRLL
jgi:hypothetical protein